MLEIKFNLQIVLILLASVWFDITRATRLLKCRAVYWYSPCSVTVLSETFLLNTKRLGCFVLARFIEHEPVNRKANARDRAT